MANSPRLQDEYNRLLNDYNLRLHAPIDPTSPSAKTFLEKYRNAPPEDLEALNEVLREPSSGLQSVIAQHANEIEAAIKNAGMNLKTDAFVGEFPTGSFNAQARPATDGVLLLINSGLMMFLHETAKVMSWSVAIAEFDENGQPKEDSVRPQSDFSHDELVATFAKLITAYLTQGDIRAAGPSPVAWGGPQMLGALITRSAEKFVLAHEYGHVLAGHLSSPRMMVASSPAGDIEFISKSWEQELEADRIGFRLALGGAPLVIDSQERLFDAQLNVAGMLWFFAMDELVTHTITRLTGQVVALCDHPPSGVRMDMLRNGVQKDARKALFAFGDQLVQWSTGIRNEVADLVRSRVLRR
jgi:hypothetical protein